jgi:hypothetical protein
MALLDDYHVSKASEPAPIEPARPPLWLPVAAAAVLIGALGGLWYVTRRPAPLPAKAAPGVTETTVDTAPRPAGTAAEPGEQIDLPPLDQSDALIRTLVSRLSSHPQIAAWLSTDELIRNMTVVVSNIADGQTPAKHLRAIKPVGAFGVRQAGAAVSIDPESYKRYDTIAAAVEGLDARGVARFYATIKPRIDEAYAELGMEEGKFDRTLERAIVTLLRTPIVEGDVRLRATSVSYTFADPNLEALSKAQRQFIRMGPRNMRIVKARLREVAQFLGIPESSLPARDQG